MSLNTAQTHVFDLVVNQHQSCIVTAMAGCGKSHVLKEIYVAIAEQGYAVLNCAFSGKASALIDGVTTHRASNLGVGTMSVLPKGVKPEPKMWQGNKRRTIESCLDNIDRRWLAPKLLCSIDEIFQLSSADARLWFDVGMTARSLSKEELPPPIFLFSGDIGQFLPIDGRLIFESADFSFWNQRGLVEHLSMPSILDEIKPTLVRLTENMRQSDPVFKQALDWLYYGIAIHPCLLERIKPAPASASTYYFNNVLVAAENENQLAKFKQQTATVYRGVGETLTPAEVKSMLPITEAMTVHVGAPFTVTCNIFGDKKMIVSNGEVVTVTKCNRHAIEVMKASGEKADLPYSMQYLPLNHHTGKRKSYQTLPGYPGSACSIMKMQGETLTVPVKVAVWQLAGGRIQPLKNYAGALYTICSRVTELDLLYFDDSLGYDIHVELLKGALKVDPRVLNFVLQGRPPLWATDRLKQEVVIEFKCKFESPHLDPTLLFLEYKLTEICSGLAHVCVGAFNYDQKKVQFLSVARLVDGKLIEGSDQQWDYLFENVAQAYINFYLTVP